MHGCSRKVWNEQLTKIPLAMKPWANYLISLGLSFLIYKIRAYYYVISKTQSTFNVAPLGFISHPHTESYTTKVTADSANQAFAICLMKRVFWLIGHTWNAVGIAEVDKPWSTFRLNMVLLFLIFYTGQDRVKKLVCNPVEILVI